jgi:hypothetical protein
MDNSKPLDTSKIEVSNILCDFEAIIDLDLAIIYYIATHLKNVDLIDTSILRASSYNALRNLLLFRTTNNPLSIIIKEEYKDSLNDLYKELMEKHEQEILDLCRFNDLASYIKILYTTGKLVNITINCDTELQVEYTKKNMPELKVVLKETNLSNYNTLFVKYSSNLLRFEEIMEKKIYIVNAMYNYNNFIFKPEVLLLIDSNKICTVDIYQDLTVPNLCNSQF